MLDPGYGQFFANISYLFIGSIGIILFLITLLVYKNVRIGIVELSVTGNIILFLYATYSYSMPVKYLGAIVWPIVNMGLVVWYIIWKRKKKAFRQNSQN